MIIKLKRGLEANIPELQEGELGFTTDSKKLFIGSTNGNIEIGGDGLLSALLLKENKSEKGVANGYASLDSGAKIPSSQLPDSILGQLEYKGTFNPSSGYPVSPEKGWFYISIGNAVISGADYNVGDWAVYNGASWDKVDNTETAALVEVTWQELKNKRDADELIPGQQYRITDYTCTTTQASTQSAGHQFDIIVTADSVNKLNEDARACLHEGDIYFANSKLEAWKLKYCLDNDATRFAWADSVNGKGVIYQMVDEFNNDCPYDFKNIQFKKSSVWLYTFKYDRVGDSYNNKIGVYISVNKATLNANTFGDRCHSNTLGYSCFSNTFGNDCISNTFGYNCYNNTFGNSCFNNAFGRNCLYNTFGNYCSSNTFGNGCGDNTFGNYCGSNTFGNSCTYLQISDISVTPKTNIHVEPGTRGASNVNRFDLYDSAILDKNYQVTFKKSASGKYLMLWANDDGTMTGKVKDSNTDPTWADIV